MTTPTEISSTKNPLVKRFRAAARGEIEGEIVIDGVRLVAEALATGVPIRVAATSPKLLSDGVGRKLRSQLESLAGEFFECRDHVIERMSSLKTPQGVIAIVDRGPVELAELTGDDAVAPLIVVAAGVRDPGNLGAIVRAAEAAGATGFVALRGSADPFRDKAVRGSSGSVLRLPISSGVTVEQLVEFATSHSLQLVIAEGTAEHDYCDVDWRKPSVLVVGAEGDGLPVELVQAATLRAKIPMVATVESLNVSVAAGVLLFEARRQRR